MSVDEADMETATRAAAEGGPDRGEAVGLMDPLLIGEGSPQRTALTDLAVELAGRAAGFRRSLPEGVQAALADLIGLMNGYASNLLDGHDTHPVAVARALRGDYSTDAAERAAQEEGVAHAAAQRWIDGGGLTGRAATAEGLCALHRRLGEMLPDALRWVADPDSGARIRYVPGQLRRRAAGAAVSPGAVPRFLARFEAGYSRLGRTDAILAAACAHHRLLWIHPFLDGNGRVARLMSHAMLRDALETGGVWSIARGLARHETAYRNGLAACDAACRGGSGAERAEALAAFARFFLTTCIEEVALMEALVHPDRLCDRILIWTEEAIRADRLPPRSDAVLEAVLRRGALPRGAVAGLLGTSERQARRVTAALIADGVLVAESSRAPLRPVFPAHLAARWLPGLFPERAAAR